MIKECQLCGEEFQCGSDEGICWCSSIHTDRNFLNYLKKVSSDCVCPQCLSRGEKKF